MIPNKRVAILVEDLYQDIEVWYPYYRLREAQVEGVLVGTGKKEYKGKYGYPLIPDATLEALTSSQFDGVIIPGGYAPDILRRYPSVIRFVQEMDRQGKCVGAICHAGWVLCSADLLRGRKITCFFAIKDDLVNAGATFIDAEVVRDGNLVTSRKPDDLPAFMRMVLEVLNADQTIPNATSTRKAPRKQTRVSSSR